MARGCFGRVRVQVGTLRRGCGGARVVAGLGVLCGTACGGPDCVLPVCDVRAPACQSSVLASVGCIRGESAPEVPVRVLSREDFSVGLSQAPPSEAAQLRFSERQAALATLELELPRTAQSQVAQQFAATVGASYSFVSQSIVMIDDGFPLDSPQSTALLAHEYVHALQDASGVLEGHRFSTTDAFLASSALVEGDAQWTSDRLYASWAGQEPDDVDWARLLNRWAGRTAAAYRRQTSRVHLAARFFIYPFGTRYAARVFAEGGQAALDAELATPPGASMEVAVGRRSAASNRRKALSTSGVPTIADAELLDTDSLGWWILGEGSRLGQALRSTGIDPSRVNPAPVDVVTLWAQRDTRTPLAAVRLRWSDPATAQRLASLWDSLEGLSARSEGSDALVLASPDEAWLAALGNPALLPWGPQAVQAPSARATQRAEYLACPPVVPHSAFR